MGAHNRIKNTKRREKAKIIEPSKRPYNINKQRCMTTIWGTKRSMIIEDEILHKQHNAHHKLIAFQRIRDEGNNHIEYRLGYYMIGVKPGMKGRWVWGQFCLFIPESDLKAILKKAERKGWFRLD